MPRWLQRLLDALYVALLTLLLVRPPRVGNPADLDDGWQGLLQFDWIHDARSGVESVFTYGPTGFLLAQSVLLPDGLLARALLGLLLALALAIALWSLRTQLPGARWRAAYLASVLLLAPFLEGSMVFQAMAALGVASVWTVGAALPSQADRAAQLVVAMAVFAVAAAAKFTYCALALGEVALVAFTAAMVGGAGAWTRVRGASAVVALFAASFAAVWLLVGQSLGDVPAWWRGAVEIASGYNDVMFSAGDEGELRWALALIAGNAVIAAALLAQAHTEANTGERTPQWSLLAVRRFAAVTLLLLALFTSWKAGFVRHDDAHAVMFFGFAATLPFALVAATGVRRVPALTVGVIAAAVAAAAWQQIAVCSRSEPQPFAAAVARAGQAVRPWAFRLPVRLHRFSQPLGKLQEMVGDEPVDLMGYQQGLLFQNDFTVRHRPVFQSYSVYTPYLQALNGAFFSGDGAPRHVLAAVQSLNSRLPMAEDSQAWRVLLDDYHLVAVEHGVLLLARDGASRPPRVPARRVVERRVALGEWVDVPDEPDWHELALDVDYSVIGRVKCALHRPARLLLEVRLRKGRGRPWSIGTQLVRSPFVLDPFISNTRDYVAACAGYDAARVAAFRVITEPGGDSDYRGEVGVQLDARPAPEHGLGPDDRRALAHVLQGVAYPDFEWFPFHIEPPDGVRSIPGERGVLAPAPCTLLFHWPGGRSGLWVVFELVRAGWSGPVHTDGAAFRIEVGDGEGGARRVVAERLLRPGDVAADRGSQRFELDLDLPRDTVVALVTDPGPSGRNQYDLTAWRRVALSPR